jgi:hypothetical protein
MLGEEDLVVLVSALSTPGSRLRSPCVFLTPKRGRGGN